MTRTLMIAMGAACVALWFPSAANAADDDQPLDLRKIALTASRSVKTRKVRRGIIPPEYGIKSRDDDFAKDDKLDIVTIKVKVANKTGQDLEGLRVVCEFYGRDVSVRKKSAGPIGAEELAVSFDAKGVFTCEFQTHTLYDRTKDEVSLNANGTKANTSLTLPPHGISFFGYKITLLSKDGDVIKETMWPSSLSSLKLDPKILERELPTCLKCGGGTLEDCVSPSKNPPGEADDNKPGDSLRKGMKGLKGLM